MERFDLKSLNDVKVTERYQVKVHNRFETWEVVDDDDVHNSSAGKVL
jgi:hypothetical protein